MADITRPYTSLEALGVQADAGRGGGHRPAARQVRLADGRTLSYDRAIVSPGVDFTPGEVIGLDSPAAQQRILHGWKAGPQTVALRRQIEAMPDGGVYALTIPTAPYRCPPGPYERACLVADYFKRAKPRSKVLVLDANPEIQSKRVLFEKAFAEHYKGIIEYRPNNELRQVDAATNTAKLDFDDVKADVLNVVPPQRAADIARSAGLVNVNNRWVGVHWLTMEATAAPGIHVLGDAMLRCAADAQVGAPGQPACQGGGGGDHPAAQGRAGQRHAGGGEHLLQLRHRARGRAHQHGAPVRRHRKDFQGGARLGGIVDRRQRARGPLALAWADNIWSDTLAV